MESKKNDLFPFYTGNSENDDLFLFYTGNLKNSDLFPFYTGNSEEEINQQENSQENFEQIYKENDIKNNLFPFYTGNSEEEINQQENSQENFEQIYKKNDLFPFYTGNSEEEINQQENSQENFEQTEQEVQSVDINYDNVKNVNRQRIKNLQNKRKKIRTAKVIIAATSIAALLTLFGIKYYLDNKHEPIMPEGYQQIYTTYEVGSGDTIYDIAQQFYDNNTYDSYYGDLRGYVNAILELNNNNERIDLHQKIQIPVLIELDNIYILQIKKLEEEIESLPEWIPHTIKNGDTIYDLAFAGAGDNNEGMKNIDRILKENRNVPFQIGKVMLIVNPKVGQLKREIIQLKKQLQESLKVNNYENISENTKLY